jgi:hypothetical protein
MQASSERVFADFAYNWEEDFMGMSVQYHIHCIPPNTLFERLEFYHLIYFNPMPVNEQIHSHSTPTVHISLQNTFYLSHRSGPACSSHPLHPYRSAIDETRVPLGDAKYKLLIQRRILLCPCAYVQCSWAYV